MIDLLIDSPKLRLQWGAYLLLFECADLQGLLLFTQFSDRRGVWSGSAVCVIGQLKRGLVKTCVRASGRLRKCALPASEGPFGRTLCLVFAVGDSLAGWFGKRVPEGGQAASLEAICKHYLNRRGLLNGRNAFSGRKQ